MRRTWWFPILSCFVAAFGMWKLSEWARNTWFCFTRPLLHTAGWFLPCYFRSAFSLCCRGKRRAVVQSRRWSTIWLALCVHTGGGFLHGKGWSASCKLTHLLHVPVGLDLVLLWLLGPVSLLSNSLSFEGWVQERFSIKFSTHFTPLYHLQIFKISRQDWDLLPWYISCILVVSVLYLCMNLFW